MKEIKLVDGPKVSIVVPMYNAEKFVAATLNCLVGQSFKDIEIIVVDDGSTDNSKAIVDKFSFDRRLRYVHKENGGTGSALNVGHKLAKGKYVTWCSADNLYYPDFIKILTQALDAAEMQGAPVELIYSDFVFINEGGKPIREVLHEKPQNGKGLINGYDIGMSFMYTKALWDKTGEYWDRICEDFNWCVRAAQHTQFGLVKNVLAGFRVHSSQISGNRKEEEKAASEDCKVLAKTLFSD